MSRPNQLSTIKRLEQETRRDLADMRDAHWTDINTLWRSTRQRLRQLILNHYSSDFLDSSWTHAEAHARGTIQKINRDAKAVLSDFLTQTARLITTALDSLYNRSACRHAWILDQVTPPNVKIRLPRKVHVVREADIPPANAADWPERLTAWVNAYSSNLDQNLLMSAINASTPQEAADLVDASKAGSPSYSLMDAIDRLFDFNAQDAIARGVIDMSTENGDAVEEEVWQVSRYGRDEDECDDNEGLTVDEADGDIPLHPNCRCYWRVVPKEYAELLRSGSEGDIDLANWMDALDMNPTSMVMRGEDGTPVAKVIVDFQDWQEDTAQSLSGGVAQ